MAQGSRAARLEVQLTKAKAEFLRDASDKLLVAAPSTSTLLNLEYFHTLASRVELEKTAKKSAVSRPSCKACGNLLVVDSGLRTWNESLQSRVHSHEKSRKRSKRDVASRRRPLIVELSQCQRCNTIVKNMQPIAHDSSSKQPITETKTSTGADKQEAIQSDQPVPNASQGNAAPHVDLQSERKSAKARAKARKQGGLQAQLEKSKSAPAARADFGFGLMDFMSAG